MMQHLAPGQILCVNVWAHATHVVLLLFCPMASAEPIHIGAGDSVSEGC